MATKHVTQAASAAPVNDSAIVRTSADLYASALSVLEELKDEQENVFSVACAGQNVTDDEASPLSSRMFIVIQKLTETTELFEMLRERVSALAKSAGVQIEVQS